MKRARSAVLAAIMAAATVTTASHAWGQGEVPSQAPAESEAMTDKARELYNEGRSLFSKRDWEKAHASFLAAWSLKKHWQIAGMLGLCEVRMQRYRDAAEHLSFAVRTGAGSMSQQETQKLREALDQAKQRVGTVRVQVDTDEAEVRVDGRLLGTAPLFDPVFLEPGTHKFRARSNERASAEVTIEVGAGGEKEIVLRVDQQAAAQEPGAAVSPAAPAGEIEGDRGVQSDTKRGMTPAIIGGAVAAVGLGVGIGFTLSANGKASDRDDAVDALGGPSACGTGTPFVSQCAEIRDLDDAESTRRKVALGGFVVGGLAAAGTVVYLLWPSETQSDQARLQPFVGPEGGGLQVLGSF